MTAHALIGSAAVCTGAAALLLAKGSSPHRLAGRWFVGLMLLMGPVVSAGVWLEPGSVSPLGILFVVFIVYLVVSAWSTIRRSEKRPGRLDMASPVVALCISLAGFSMGFDAIGTLGQTDDLPPREAYFFFAAIAFVAMLLDVNNLRVKGLRGKHRIARHVWRMGCALFFATSTLFTGPGSIVFPESVRGSHILFIPQLLVLILACFWLYRLLFSKRRTCPEVMTTSLESQASNHSRTENIR